MIWDVDSSDNTGLMEVSWGVVLWLVVMSAEFWVGLVMDVVLDVWLLVVTFVGHNCGVRLNNVSVVVEEIVMAIVCLVWVLNDVLNDMVGDVVLDELVMWNIKVLLMVHWGMVDFVGLSMGYWNLMVEIVDLVVGCLLVLMDVPLGVVVSWVDLSVRDGVMGGIMGPGVVVDVMGWLNVGVMDGVGFAGSVVVDIVGDNMVGISSSPCEVVVPVGVSDGVWDFPVVNGVRGNS